MRTTEVPKVLHLLTSWALDHGDDLTGLTVARESLEDVYLRLTDGAQSTQAVEVES